MHLFSFLPPSQFLNLTENDACASPVSSDAIARVPSKLTRKLIKRPIKMKKIKTVFESQQFDQNHVSTVLSKLDAASTDAQQVETKSFGFEDTDGNIIKVMVGVEDADAFKQKLADSLAQIEADGKSIEVAELLFNLRNEFNIINVQWPTAVEDEEPLSQPVDGQEASTPPTDGTTPVDAEQPQPAPQDGGNDLTSNALDAMLQALIADAEARRQEAVAKAAEARAKEAAAAAEMSRQKLAAEEEVADMESFYSSQNEQQKEAKKLAKLAKFRHQMRKGQQQLRSTAYTDALDAQDDDSMISLDTAEDSRDPANTGDDLELAAKNKNSVADGIEDDPTATLDSELKTAENEEVEMVKPSINKDNLMRALRTMSGAR